MTLTLCSCRQWGLRYLGHHIIARTPGLGIPSFMMTLRWSFAIRLAYNQYMWVYFKSWSLASMFRYLFLTSVIAWTRGFGARPARRPNETELEETLNVKLFFLKKKYIPSLCIAAITSPCLKNQWGIIGEVFLQKKGVRKIASTRWSSTWDELTWVPVHATMNARYLFICSNRKHSARKSYVSSNVKRDISWWASLDWCTRNAIVFPPFSS